MAYDIPLFVLKSGQIYCLRFPLVFNGHIFSDIMLVMLITFHLLDKHW